MTAFFAKIVALFCSVIFSIAGVPQSTVGYTEGTPLKGVKQDYCFDNSGILIGGYYGGLGNGKLAHDAGLDFVIDSDVTLAQLTEYALNDVGIIAAGYNLPSAYASVSDDQINPWLNINLLQYKNHPALWGDDLIDEPSAKYFETLEKAVKSHREALPNKITLINLFPNYASEEQLGITAQLNFFQQALLLTTDLAQAGNDSFRAYVSEYINTIDTDYICYDTYPYNSTVDKDGNEVKTTYKYYLRGLDILADACKNTDRDLWVITQAAGETKDGSVNPGKNRYCDEVSDISQQAYASLSFGAKAIIHGLFGNKGWWDIDSHMLGSDGKPTDTYYSVQKVNTDLKYFSDIYAKYTYTSTYMMNKSKVAGFTAGTLLTTDADEIIDIKSSNGLLIGTFTAKDGGKAYVVTNMEELNNNVTATAQYKVPDGKTVTLYQQSKPTVFNAGDTMNITLTAGEGVFFTIG